MDDKCNNDATCVSSVQNFLKLQNKAENMAARSRRYCKDSKSIAMASAGAAIVCVAAAAASVSLSAASGWWFSPLTIGAVGISAVAATASAAAGGAALAALATYRSTLTKAKAAIVIMSAAYDKMIDDCGKECAAKRQFDAHC